MSPSTTSPPVWLITGCTSGFGEELVYQLLARGQTVVGAGRNATSRCQDLVKLGASIVDLDLNWGEYKINAAIAKATALYGSIDVLVNNAGYVAMDFIEELTTERLAEVFNVNFMGTFHVTRAVFEGMRERGSGRVGFMGSIGCHRAYSGNFGPFADCSQSGWDGSAGLLGYALPKFALEAFSECLSREGALFGVESIIFEPGVTNTGITAKCIPARGRKLKLYDAIHAGAAEFMKDFVEPCEKVEVVKAVIDVLMREEKMPMRLPLGSDGLQVVRRKCEETLRICEEWESVIVGVDRQGAKGEAVATPFGEEKKKQYFVDEIEAVGLDDSVSTDEVEVVDFGDPASPDDAVFMADSDCGVMRTSAIATALGVQTSKHCGLDDLAGGDGCCSYGNSEIGTPGTNLSECGEAPESIIGGYDSLASSVVATPATKKLMFASEPTIFDANVEDGREEIYEAACEPVSVGKGPDEIPVAIQQSERMFAP